MVKIIAEAGVNHNGSVELALRLVDAAAGSGADFVKFQLFNADALASSHAAKAKYQVENTKCDETQLEMLRKLELDGDAIRLIMRRCKERKINFLCTPFESGSLALLLSMGVDCIKISSGEITNLPFLREVGCAGVKVFLSTGMSTLSEVAAALDILENAGTPRCRITLLHCTTDYPAKPEEVNLRAMTSMRAVFSGLAGVGYSDHTAGIGMSVAAVALGASVVEKHFTLDKGMDGPDHRASLEPDELTALCREIRAVETALGDGVKAPSASEKANLGIVRKSIVASRAIQVDEQFRENMLTVKRPGTGLSPMQWDRLIGRFAQRNYMPNEAIDPGETE